MKRVSLICGDGGIRGGFIAGAMARLLEDFPNQIKNLQIATASSASIGSMLYYLSDKEKHLGCDI